MNIYERINKEVAATTEATADAIAQRVMRMCSRDDLVPLLVAAIENVQRAYVRRDEQRHLAKLVASFRPSLLPSVPSIGTSEFLPLLRRTIKVGKGNRTTWGLATIEEHKTRLAMLMAQRNGLTETIRRHEEAIRLLEESGATCLAELANVEERAA